MYTIRRVTLALHWHFLIVSKKVKIIQIAPMFYSFSSAIQQLVVIYI